VYAKILLDSIFGRQNFIGDIIWQKRKGGWNDSRYLALNHAYILVYAKNAAKEMHSLKWRTAQSEEYLKRYKELDPDGKRLWNCIISRGKMKEIFNLDNKNMFDELLDSISSAFEYWRYIYEKDNGFININF